MVVKDREERKDEGRKKRSQTLAWSGGTAEEKLWQGG